jgi:hypothetical protein
MQYKQKNCFMANLCKLLEMNDISHQDLLWALVDIDTVNFKSFGVNLIPCYLTMLGVYSDQLWIQRQAESYDELIKQVYDQHDRIQLTSAPMSNINYRNEIGNQVFHSDRHAFLIDCQNEVMLQDETLGSTGDSFVTSVLQSQHFSYPLTTWLFDAGTFKELLCAETIQQNICQYAHNLVTQRDDTITMKRDLLIKALNSDNRQSLARANLFEETFFYRWVFIAKYGITSMLTEFQIAYQQALSQFKSLSCRLRLETCPEKQYLLNRKTQLCINHLYDMDHTFYETFEQYV